jgi:copper homeostasis protein
VSGPVSIEICVDSAASATAAELGGANRVELCSNLSEGGVTPSFGLLELVRSRISIGLHVMIRPRGGEFCYAVDEFETMRRDILIARKIGADGVVLGILLPDGSVDVGRTRQLVELARPLTVTFHRAFDTSPDLFRAFEDVCVTGVNRLLTSGGEQTAALGIDKIAGLVQASSGRVAIMAGGGIREHNVASVIERTGVGEIHSGLSNSVSDPATCSHPRISIGSAERGEYQAFQVLPQDVRKFRDAAALARI